METWHLMNTFNKIFFFLRYKGGLKKKSCSQPDKTIWTYVKQNKKFDELLTLASPKMILKEI